MNYIIKKFGAIWCKNCNVLNDELKKYELLIQLNDYDYDNENHSKFFDEYNITSLPTLLILNNDTIIDKLEGFSDKKISLLYDMLIKYNLINKSDNELIYSNDF